MTTLDHRRKLLSLRLPEGERDAFLNFRTALAAELKRMRKDENVSIAEAAKRMGVTKRTVMEWEAGVMPSVEVLVVYCRLMGRRLTAVLSGAGE